MSSNGHCKLKALILMYTVQSRNCAIQNWTATEKVEEEHEHSYVSVSCTNKKHGTKNSKLGSFKIGYKDSYK